MRAVRPFELRALNERILAGPQPRTVLDVHELTLRGVTHVLDLREPAEWPPGAALAVQALEQRLVERMNVAMQDARPPAAEALGQAVAWLEAALAEPGTRVMVHCRAGIERTGTVLAAYLVQVGLSLDEALAVLSLRCRCQPLPLQVAAVRAWAATR